MANETNSGSAEGATPTDIKGMTDESWARLVTDLAKAMSPGLNQAVEKSVEKTVDDRLKTFHMTPPTGKLVKDGADPEDKDQKESLISEYLRWRYVPEYGMREAKTDFGEVQKAVAGMMTDKLRKKTPMSTVATNAGAELVATEYVRELIEALPDIVPFRKYVQTRTMTENSLNLGKVTQKPTASFKAELVPATPSETETADVVLIAKTCVALTEPFSRELAADARNNFVVDMARWLKEAIDEKCQEVVASGDGTSEPQGFDQIDAGQAWTQVGTHFGWDDIIGMIRMLNPRYLNGATWWTNGIGFSAIELIRDSTGQPIVTDPMAAFLPRVRGFEAIRMAGIGGTGVVSDPVRIYFGQGKRFYTWGDRQSLELATSVDGENFAKNSMQMRGVVRVDGKITLDEAMVYCDAHL